MRDGLERRQAAVCVLVPERCSAEAQGVTAGEGDWASAAAAEERSGQAPRQK